MTRYKRRTDGLEQVITDERDDPGIPTYLAYMRQSTEADQGLSVEDQYRECVRAVKAMGGCLSKETVLLDFHLAKDPGSPRRFVGAFGDRAKGIVSQRDREGFGQLLEFANKRAEEGRPIAGVIVCDLSRQTRKRSWSLFAEIAECLDYGLRVIFAEDGTVAEPENDLFTIMKIGMRGESNNQAAVDAANKTTSALAKLVKNGLWPGGNPPPGYTLEDALDFPAENFKGCSTRVVKTGEPLHEELIKAAFSMPFQHGLAATAEYLTRKGLRTSSTKRNNNTPGRITINVLRDTILRNEIYCGRLAWPRRNRPRYKSKKRPATVGYKDKDSVVTYLPEIAYVSEDEFEAMQNWLVEQSSSRGAFGQKKLLTGVLKCPYHKTNLYEDGKGWYRCKHVGECKLKGIPSLYVENQVYSAIVLLLTREENAVALVEHFAESRLSAQEKKNSLEEALAECRRRKQKLLAQFGDLDCNVDDVAVLQIIRSLESQAAKITCDIDLCDKELMLTKEKLLALGAKFYMAPIAEKNAMLRTMLRKVKINKKNGLLELQFSDLLHNLHLSIKRFILLPPTIQDAPDALSRAVDAAVSLVSETLQGRISRSTRKEYQEAVGEWGHNCLIELEVMEDDPENDGAQARPIGILKKVEGNQPPTFVLAEGRISSERVTCGDRI